jgi:hypothetical protein
MSNTPLPHLCNKDFVCEIETLRERNVLLLLVDGTAVFGRIGRIHDCVISIVPPIGVTALNLVQLRPPNPTLAIPLLVSQILIDLCDVAHIVEGPFVTSPLTLITAASADPNATPSAARSTTAPITTRPQRELLDELCDLQAQNLGITTLGGWSILGVLGDVDDCVSLISSATTAFPPLFFIGAVTIIGPAFPGGLIVLFGTFRVWSNLRTLTQVILP